MIDSNHQYLSGEEIPQRPKTFFCHLCEETLPINRLAWQGYREFKEMDGWVGDVVSLPVQECNDCHGPTVLAGMVRPEPGPDAIPEDELPF